MEQTQLSLDRPTTPSNEPDRPEESEFGQLHSLDVSVSEMATSSPPVNDDGSKIDCVLSQVDEEQKEGIGHRQNSEAENSGVNPAKTETSFRVLNLNGSESPDGQCRNIKMDLKDNDGDVVELKCANSTPSFDDDNISLSQNSDTRPTTSEGESSSGKDDCDLLLTDVSKSDSPGEADANDADCILEQKCRDNLAFDADEKETTFTDSVVPVSDSAKTGSGDRTLNKGVGETQRQTDEHPSKQEEHVTVDGASKTGSLMPVHFQKKVKGSELSATPPKKMQKRKAGTSKLCTQAGEAERGESKYHRVPNGLCKSKDAKRMTEETAANDHIIILDGTGTGRKENEERKTDRISMCVEDSDCESDTSSWSEEPTCWLEQFRFVRKHLLTLSMALSIIFGIVLGSCLRDSISSQDQRRIIYLRFPGELFLNILHMLVIPLMLSTLVSNLAAMDTQSIRKLGLRSLFYYSVTTFIALVTGIILAMTAQPGKFDQLSGTGGPVPKVNPVDAVLDLLRNIFPDNIIAACFRKFTTQQMNIIRWPEVQPTSSASLDGTTEFDPEPENLTPYPDENSTNVESSSNSPVTLSLLPEAIIQANTSEFYRPIVTQTEGTNFLGLVLASVAIGTVISSMGHQGRPLQDFFNALNVVFMKITRIVMLYSPIGIFFLVAAKVVEVEFPQLTFHRLLMYTITVLVGLLGHGFVILPLVYFLMTRKNPIPFMYGISQGIITALATSSSAATLPIMLRCLERKNQVSSHVARFVAPVGAVINLNGTALYQAMACIFIAQHRAVDLTISQMALMSVIATLASIGSACIPQSGLLTLVAVLTSVGLPQEDAALILTVDWILDRVSTMVNVIGDAVGAGLIYQMIAKEESRRKRP